MKLAFNVKIFGNNVVTKTFIYFKSQRQQQVLETQWSGDLEVDMKPDQGWRKRENNLSHGH